MKEVEGLRDRGLPVDMGTILGITGMVLCRASNKLLLHIRHEQLVRLFCKDLGSTDYREILAPDGERFEGVPLAHEGSHLVLCRLVRGSGVDEQHSLAQVDMDREAVCVLPFPRTIPSWNVWPRDLLGRTADLSVIYLRLGQLAMHLVRGESNVLYTIRAYHPSTGELELLDTLAGPYF